MRALLLAALFVAGCDWLAYSPSGLYDSTSSCDLQCDPNARCVVEGEAFRCVCNEGFSGDGATCAEIPTCAKDNGGCDQNAICSDSSGSVTCACKPGWTGEGHACVDVDECAADNGGCDPLTVCTNTPGARTCGACPSGYSGDGTSGCADIDECASNNGGCGANEACTNLPGSKQCGCKAGFVRDGEACVDIDECKSNNGGCDPLTTCSNSEGTFSCSACPTGYTGSGEAGCSDVDECAANNGGCDPLTVCTNTPGARTCGACPSGYTGDGASGCVDVDECAANNGGCDPLTTCTNRPGARTCGACPAGYAGDGATGCVWNDPSLSALEVSQGQLLPAFSAGTTSYRVEVPLRAETFSVRPTVPFPQGATIRVDGVEVASGASSTAKALALGTNTVSIEVRAQTGATRTYTLTVERALFLAQQAYVKSSQTAANTLFGNSLAISGDTLVVGAGNEDNGTTTDAGAAYVFVRSGTSWSQQARFRGPIVSANDKFGASVAIEGDTIALGSPGEDGSGTGVNTPRPTVTAQLSGAVFVFTRSGTTWTQQAYIKASNTNPSDQFGSSVALSGETLVVGAPTEGSNATGVNGNQADNSLNAAGAVYVFTRSGSTWSQQAYLKASNTGAYDYFGSVVSLSGDTLAVGTLFEDSSATGVNGNQANDSAQDSGAAYVFVRSGATWSQQAYLKASNTAASARFGCSLSLSGNTLAVGARQESTGGGASGAVYVFTRSGSAWSQQALLKASNAEAQDFFGSSVALVGDVLAVGAPAEASSATGVNGDQANNVAFGSGAAYVFARLGSSWSQQAYVKASNTFSSQQFGSAVALTSDTLVVGAPGEMSNATGVNGDQSNKSMGSAGASYVFKL